MYIYVYVDEIGNLVEYFTNIQKFKKKYDNVLMCVAVNNLQNLGHKKICNLIKEFGYCKLEYKKSFLAAGYLQPVKEGK